MSEVLNHMEEINPELEQTVIDEEEFFERDLFDDVLEMKSIKKFSEATSTNLNQLQDRVYQNLFNLFQETRGITTGTSQKDEVFAIFELFFKNYYQHFRVAMENLISTKSPIKVAYFLGKNTDKITAMLSHFIKEIEQEVS